MIQIRKREEVEGKRGGRDTIINTRQQHKPATTPRRAPIPACALKHTMIKLKRKMNMIYLFEVQRRILSYVIYIFIKIKK